MMVEPGLRNMVRFGSSVLLYERFSEEGDIESTELLQIVGNTRPSSFKNDRFNSDVL